MLELRAEAEKAGITAIIGLGASPGQSNMLAAKALSYLDSVDQLVTGWGVGGDSDIGQEDGVEDGPGGSGSYGAAIEHWVHQLTGTIRVFQKGQYADVKPIQDVYIDYPDIGRGISYTVGHPEPVTLPMFRKDIKNSCNVMVISPRLIAQLRELAKAVDDGLLTVPQAARMIMEPSSMDEMVQTEEDESLKKDPELPSLFAYVKGQKNGQEKTVGVTVLAGVGGGMGGATGVPMAIGLKLLNAGKISKHGVFSPEMVIDPDDFFDELGPLCSFPAPVKSAKEMLMITQS